MPANLSESSPHTSLEDRTEADTVPFSEDYVMQSGKIARLGEWIESGRKFERAWSTVTISRTNLNHDEVALLKPSASDWFQVSC